MIAYLVLGVCLLVAFVLASRWFLSADPRVLAKALRYGGMGLLALAAAFLMLTGRFALGIIPAVIAFGIWRRMGTGASRFPFGLGGSRGGATPGRTSDVATDYLRMTLEHDTGLMSGEVLRGSYAGRSLSELTLDELIELLAECRREDPPAAQLLETYLDRMHGPDWRDSESQAGTADTPRSSGGAMTVAEARDILGVADDASAEEIRAAHHRLMLQHHPDRGGSSDMAAKINQAKDILLQS